MIMFLNKGNNSKSYSNQLVKSTRMQRGDFYILRILLIISSKMRNIISITIILISFVKDNFAMISRLFKNF